MKIALLLVLSFFAYFSSTTNPWQDLMILDCTGKFTMTPNLPLTQSIFDASLLVNDYEWFMDQLYERFLCGCPNTPKNDFLSTYAIASVDYYLNYLQGTNRFKSTTCPDSPWDTINFFGNDNVNIGPISSNPSCSLSSYQSGAPCMLQAQAPGFDMKFQIAFQRCPNKLWPFISLTCSGAGCGSIGKPCMSSSDCSSTETCTTIPTDVEDDYYTPGFSKRSFSGSQDDTSTHTSKNFLNFEFLTKIPQTIAKFIKEGITKKRNGQEWVYSTRPLNYNDFLNIMINMNLYSTEDTQYYVQPGTFFSDLINSVSSLLWSSTSTFSWGNPPIFQMCLPPNALNYTYWTYGCSVTYPTPPTTPTTSPTTSPTGPPTFSAPTVPTIPTISPTTSPSTSPTYTDVQCSGITAWNGVLDDGTMVNSENRLNGNFNSKLTINPTAPTLPADAGSSKPSATIFYLTCSNQMGNVLLKGAAAGGVCLAANAIIQSFIPTPPSPPSSSNDNNIEYEVGGFAAAGLVAAFVAYVPGINQMANIFFTEMSKVETNRAAALGTPLSPDAFKARFGYIPDWVMYSWFPNVPTYGPTMTDFVTTEILGSQKFSMPDSCSYATWLSTGSCSFEYTGLQSLLNADITIRLQMTECPSYSLPAITMDCSGAACPVLAAPMPCTQDSQCPTGTVCYNPSVLFSGSGSTVDPLGAFLNLGASNPFNIQNSCTGSGHFEAEIASLIQNITGYTSTPLQFCFWDITSLLNSFSSGGSNSNWFNEQYTANGNTLGSIYIREWVPSNAPQPKSGSVTITITVSSGETSEDLISKITSILVQNGYPSTTFTVTATIGTGTGASVTVPASVTVSASDSSVTEAIALQLNNQDSPLAEMITTQVGQYSSVSSPSAATTLIISVFVIFVALFILW